MDEGVDMGLVIPVFIAHQGCPHLCSFCNQHSISGASAGALRPEDVGPIIEQWLDRSAYAETVQVAFYGGSFTCLAQDYQKELLAAVHPYLRQERVSSIRLSTRPDCIDEKSCRFLRDNGVKTVELGVQSMSDVVLEKAGRGHDGQCSLDALRLLHQSGFEVGVQLLIGLPHESRSSFLRGVYRLIDEGPDFFRLYPLLLVTGSELTRQYQNGCYVPISLELALILAARAKEIVETRGARVVRMGLQASDQLECNLVAGPHHPAFGELVNSRLWLKRIRRAARCFPKNRAVEIVISPRDQSAFWGQGGCNRVRLEQLEIANRFQLKFDESLARGTMKVCYL
ncbi:MAG: radical SAM protein [Thermodesulfobacteriota bacterium]